MRNSLRPFVSTNAKDSAVLESIELHSTNNNGWCRWKITWDGEHAPYFDCVVRSWRLLNFCRVKDVEHIEVSPDGRFVYFDGCLHRDADEWRTAFPTHGYGTLAVQYWTADRRPVVFTKTWNHMLSTVPGCVDDGASRV